MAWDPRYESFSNVKHIVGDMGDQMEPKLDHISGAKPFPEVRIWHNASQYVTRGSVHSKGSQNQWINAFWKVDGDPLEVTIPLIGALKEP